MSNDKVLSAEDDADNVDPTGSIVCIYCKVDGAQRWFSQRKPVSSAADPLLRSRAASFIVPPHGVASSNAAASRAGPLRVGAQAQSARHRAQAHDAARARRAAQARDSRAYQTNLSEAGGRDWDLGLARA